MAGAEVVMMNDHEEPVPRERFLKGLFFDARWTLEAFGFTEYKPE